MSLVEEKLRERDQQLAQIRDADEQCREYQRGHIYHMLAGMRELERVKRERGSYDAADFRAKR